MTIWVPVFMQNMAQYIANPSIEMYGRWNHAAANEGGVDLASPGGSPVYAIADGVVIGAHDFWHNPPNVLTPTGGNPGFGVVTTRVNVPGYGEQDLYYQHIDINPAIATCVDAGCGGQIIHRGDLVGWIRPDVGELEMGFNARWGPPWENNQTPAPAPWATDPRPMLVALLSQGVPPILGSQPTYNGMIGLGFGAGGADPLVSLLTSNPWLSNPMRIVKMLVGMIMIALAIFVMVEPDAISAVEKYGKYLLL